LVRAPIAHAEGCYTDSPAALDALEAAGGVVFRYVDENGERTDAANPNGSSRSIAGICSAEGNVLGMMPHPERCAEEILGNRDGAGLFASLVEAAVDAAPPPAAAPAPPVPAGARR
jgi:phosphoribosylformylglycinamidine synthase